MAVYTTYTYGPGNFYWFLASLLDYFPALDTAIPNVRISSILPAQAAAAAAGAAAAGRPA